MTYLPHREVVREDKMSTKVRVVFDASAKGSNGVSLNDCLYKGDCLVPLLYDLLLKFRANSIALTADIEKAYLQISVLPEHRDFLRFLWFMSDDVNETEIKKFRFCRVIFGATCSQSLLTATVNNHGRKYERVDPEIARKVKDHFYVDDLNTGVKTSEEGLTLYKNMKSRFIILFLERRAVALAHPTTLLKTTRRSKSRAPLFGVQMMTVYDQRYLLTKLSFTMKKFRICAMKRF